METPTRYSVQTEKLLARNENEPFWQWFWAKGQKCLKTSFWRFQKPDIRSRPKNGSRAMKMTRSGNGFGPGAGNALKRPYGSSKNQIFGPDRKMARAQWKWVVLAMVLSQELDILQKADLESPNMFQKIMPESPHASKTHTLIPPMRQKPIP